MLLAFYSVGNSQDYERHTFDELYDEPEKIKEMLNKLGEDELRVYDIENKYDIDLFQEDYNDEDLDGGWWCVPIFE